MPDAKKEELVELEEETTETVEVQLSNEGDTTEPVEVVESEEIEEESEDPSSDIYPTEEELAGFGKKTRKRIDILTAKLREADRREVAALDYANSVKDQNASLQSERAKLNESYGKEYAGRVETNLESAKQKYVTAYENGDPEELVNATQELSRLAVENATIQNDIPILRPQQPLLQATPSSPPPDPRSSAWAQKNEWFGVDEPMTYAAFAIHKNLLDQGFNPNSDAYYSAIDTRLQEEFPHKFSENVEVTPTSAKPSGRSSVQRVASANRAAKPSGRTDRVTLTPSQVTIARKLGVPLEDYARQVKEISANA